VELIESNMASKLVLLLIVATVVAAAHSCKITARNRRIIQRVKNGLENSACTRSRSSIVRRILGTQIADADSVKIGDNVRGSLGERIGTGSGPCRIKESQLDNLEQLADVLNDNERRCSRDVQEDIRDLARQLGIRIASTADVDTDRDTDNVN